MYHSVLALAPKPLYSRPTDLLTPSVLHHAVDIQPADSEEPLSTPTVWDLEAMCKEPDRRFNAPLSLHPNSATISMVTRFGSNEDCTSRVWSR